MVPPGYPEGPEEFDLYRKLNAWVSNGDTQGRERCPGP
jgi:cytochrome P450